MSDGQPIVDRFREDIELVLLRYRSAKCLSYAEAIGTLYLIIAELARDEADDEEYDP